MVNRPFARVVACILLIALAGCGSSTSTSNPPAHPTPKPPIALTVPSIATTPTTPVSNSTDWTTYHRDNARSGYLASASHPQRLTHLWSVQLDGTVYAEPLVVAGHVLVATENDSLSSLDAPSVHA